MKKFYLFVLTAFPCFLFLAHSAQAQTVYSTFNVVGNVSDPTIWAPPNFQPPLGVPCTNCLITINGTITDDLNDLIVNGNSQITISGGSTAIVNKWIEIHDNTQVLVSPNATLFVNDELDLINGATIRLADNTSVANANNDLGNFPFTGPNATTIGTSGIFYVYSPGVFDVSLSSIGQQSAGGAMFNPYTINCGGAAPQPACAAGIVYGPAITQSVSGFVQFVTTTPLPVTLVEFAGRLNPDHTVGLSWTTSLEVNSDYFSVQRSADGSNWQQLGTVKAKGFSSVSSNYSFTDPTPLNGTGYYRLKIVDQDGKYEFSKVISVSLNDQPVPLVVYNNPFADAIRLKINTAESDNLSLVLADVTGKILIRQTLNTQAGDNLVNLYPTGTAKGVYILTIRGNTYYQTAKLLKQ